ncbi:MAG: DUF1684 domain-containing protein [Bacteroidota bacterium]
MRTICCLLVFFFIFACNPKKAQVDLPELSHPKHIELNEQYADAEKSPLKKEDLAKFKSLKFYPANEAFKVKAQIERTPEAKPFEMVTSTDRLPVYRKYMNLKFTIDGVEQQLAAYRNQAFIGHPEYGNLLFIPFLDETNGIESYGGGRYIDIEIPDENATEILLDFNGCYNPYCAYNDKYSCPKPPLENALDVEIKAGVQYGLILD